MNQVTFNIKFYYLLGVIQLWTDNRKDMSVKN